MQGRTLPNFLVVGAAKSGTTSLCHYLRQHPDVFMAREKESHYFLFCDGVPNFTGPGDMSEFSKLIIADRAQYLACFAAALAQRAVGEASVYYLYRPEALRRALDFNPDMRFVAILREPVARAFSAYAHQRRDRWEPLDDFKAALAAEADRVDAGWGFGWHYSRGSDYVPQLEQARAIVPEGQLHVLLYDDLKANPVATLQDVFAFLGVDNSFVCDTSLRLNASGTPRYPRLNDTLARQNLAKDVLKRVVPYGFGLAVQQRLRNWNLRPERLDGRARSVLESYFDLDPERLQQLIGRDVQSWLPSNDAR